MVQCDCPDTAVKQTVKKEGKNKGKFFKKICSIEKDQISHKRLIHIFICKDYFQILKPDPSLSIQYSLQL